MTIELNPELEAIVERQIATGRYCSAAEVLRDALSLLDQNQESPHSQVRQLNDKIDKGLKSLEQGKSIDGELFFDELRQKEEQLNPPRK